MINKILIKAIIEELLKDTFLATFIMPTYAIKRRHKNWRIEINALLVENNLAIEKTDKITVSSWVKLMLQYSTIKQRLEQNLIKNIKEV